MDAEVDAALAVFFLRLREGGKTPRYRRAHIPLIVFRLSASGGRQGHPGNQWDRDPQPPRRFTSLSAAAYSGLPGQAEAEP
jgi:hypothetical protein